MNHSVVEAEALVIGAGVAGLACARDLAEAGVRVIVLDRSRGVGGRCASRRVDGVPVDHGVVFIHGDAPDFLDAVDATASTRLDGWPERVRGTGAPCQPSAFEPDQRRLAFVDGVSAFPKSLARGLDVRLGQNVERITRLPESLAVESRDGAAYRSRRVVLALALEQTRGLLDGLESDDLELTAVRRLLSIFHTVPCLTLLAGYPPTVARPDWDVAYPEESSVLQLVSHDSMKRPDAMTTTLVLQARPAWSRMRESEAPESWSRAMLAEAGRLLGGWAAAPEWTQAHTWRFARLEAGAELAAPVLLRLDGGTRLGLAGELFAPGGGVQAAFLSGRRLARRLLSE